MWSQNWELLGSGCNPAEPRSLDAISSDANSSSLVPEESDEDLSELSPFDVEDDSACSST